MLRFLCSPGRALTASGRRRLLAAGITVAAMLASGQAALAGTVVLGDLPRRAWLGTQLSPGPEGYPAVAALLPGSPAGLRAGDVLRTLDGAELTGPGAVGAALAGRHAGDKVRVGVRREGRNVEVDLTLTAYPFEKSDEMDVIYDVVEAGDVRMRCVLTRPKDMPGRLPAVLFVQGLQCAPPDQPLGDPGTVLQLMHEITRAGYVVMRVEKPGSGDATGPPCADIGFPDELNGFRAALAKLESYDFVDPAQVFLFGHSLGGLEVPMLAAERPVKGVIVFGTGILPWAEYLVQNERRQTRLDPAANRGELETRCRRLADFLHEVFRNGRAIDAVVTERPELADLAKEYWPDGEHSFGRHLRFFRELDAVNHAEQWMKVDAPVLAVWGDLDYTTSEAEHRYLAEIVNASHPGAATVVVLPRVFHAFNVRESAQQALEAPWQGPLAESVVETVIDWMREVRT